MPLPQSLAEVQLIRGGSSLLYGPTSLSYVGVFALAEPGIERHQGKVARLLYYKATYASGAKNLLVYLTADNRVTDYDLVSD